MNKIKDLLSFSLKLFLYTIRGIVRIIPRSNYKWVFGANSGFRDNPKYLYLSTKENHPEIRAIWIAKKKTTAKYLNDKGYEAYHWSSLKGLFHVATSKVLISDHSTADINQFLAEGSYYVNLWHGASVKRARWQALDTFVRAYGAKNKQELFKSLRFRVTEYPVLFRTNDLCLAPSSSLKQEFFAQMMNMPEEDCVVGVYPRSKLLIEGKEAALDFIKRYEDETTLNFVSDLQNYQKVYIYMPTWRSDSHDFIAQAGIDWHSLNEVMQEKNELFILKLHPFTKLNLEKLSQLNHIQVYPPDSDIYAVLPFIDCLITDYSSIYTDFLTMNKEIILFVFDYEEYVKNSSELYDYDKYYIGKRAYSFTELLEIIKSGEDCHVPNEKYDFLMDYFWDGNRCNIDIVDVIKKRIGIN